MKINQFLLAMVVVAAAVAVTVYGDDVTLIEDGQSRCVIRVSPRVMAPDREVPSEAALEQDRRRLRESVRDLAHYLEKMSGAAVSISTDGSAAGGNRADPDRGTGAGRLRPGRHYGVRRPGLPGGRAAGPHRRVRRIRSGQQLRHL